MNGMSIAEASALVAEYDRAYEAGDTTHPALNGDDPAHMDTMADLLAARGVLAAQPPAASPEPAAPAKATPRAPWLADKFAHHALDQQLQQQRQASLTAAKTGTTTPDKIDYEAQQIIDETFDPDGTTWRARAYRDPLHPRNKEATDAVMNARRALTGGAQVLLRIGESAEELAERAAHEAEAAENAVVRFDPTIENPRISGEQLSTEEWEEYGRAAAADGVSTSTVQTVVAAFLSSQGFPDATDDDLRRFLGPSFKEEIPYGDRALRWLDKNTPSRSRIRAVLDAKHVPVPVWVALIRAGRELERGR